MVGEDVRHLHSTPEVLPVTASKRHQPHGRVQLAPSQQPARDLSTVLGAPGAQRPKMRSLERAGNSLTPPEGLVARDRVGRSRRRALPLDERHRVRWPAGRTSVVLERPRFTSCLGRSRASDLVGKHRGRLWRNVDHALAEHASPAEDFGALTASAYQTPARERQSVAPTAPSILTRLERRCGRARVQPSLEILQLQRRERVLAPLLDEALGADLSQTTPCAGRNGFDKLR